MSLFPRSFINNDQSTFPPLFRLLDEFDNYSRSIDRPLRNQFKSFTPKFDVKEVQDAYELHGELPGIDQKDIEIEFTDGQTLTIKGRTERKYTRGTPPAGFVEGAATKGAITEGGEHHDKFHKATVEDEGGEEQSSAVQQVKNTQESKQQEGQAEPEEKFWVSERSIGEFSRSFSFPVRVDQDAVKASMKNGILSILVPKARKAESRKITIQ